jgi:Immunoglobulin-like domain of bacterial spore germination/Sporulation and spore germination
MTEHRRSESGGEAMTQTNPNAEQHTTGQQSDRQPSRSLSRLLVILGAGLAAAVVIAAIVLAVNNDDDGTTPAGSPAESVQPSDAGGDDGHAGDGGSGQASSVTEMHDAAFEPGTATATMYYLGPVSPATGQVYLFAEPHSVGQVSPQAAVREFLTSYPLDPDYRSGWPEGVDVTGIETAGGQTTIALTGTADLAGPGDLDKQAAQTAIQGLIRTAAISDGTVVFTYNDEPLSTLLGINVAQGVEPLPEQSSNFAVTTRAAIQVTSPVEGQTMTNPVVVTGNGNVFEGTVNWQLLDDRGRELDSGFVTTAMGSWEDFRVELGALDPGTYTFRALEYSAEDGSEINVDDKTFLVE